MRGCRVASERPVYLGVVRWSVVGWVLVGPGGSSTLAGAAMFGARTSTAWFVLAVFVAVLLAAALGAIG